MLQETLTKCWKDAFDYSRDNKNGNRSSKRTDILNQRVVNLFEYALDQNIQATDEAKIDCARGESFSIDLYFRELKTFVLIKSCESSYNKNRHNYTNTMAGETQRIYGAANKGAHNDHTTIFINFIPRTLPVKDGSGTIKKYEDVKYCHIEPDLKGHSQNVYVIDVPLDVEWGGIDYTSVEIDNKVALEILTKIQGIFQEKHED